MVWVLELADLKQFSALRCLSLQYSVYQFYENSIWRPIVSLEPNNPVYSIRLPGDYSKGSLQKGNRKQLSEIRPFSVPQSTCTYVKKKVFFTLSGICIVHILFCRKYSRKPRTIVITTRSERPIQQHARGYLPDLWAYRSLAGVRWASDRVARELVDPAVIQALHVLGN